MSAIFGDMARPLAVFTILAVYWGNLEYRVRVLIPWRLMSNKPQPAEQSVLLDYVSPMQPVVLFSSARARHWPVLTADIGSTLIIALTVVSTTLFVLEHTVLEQDQTPMTLSSRINNTLFDQSVIDSSPVLSTSTIMSGNLFMAYPLGTNQQYATEVFGKSDEADGTSSLQRARVRVATSDLSCHRGHITQSQFIPIRNYVQLNVSDGSCHSDQLSLTVALTNDTIRLVLQSTALCPNDITQMALIVTKFKIPPYSGDNQELDEMHHTPRMIDAINSTVFFCEPQYNFEDADVTLSATGIQNITNRDIVAIQTNTSRQVVSGNTMINGFQKALMDAKVSISPDATDFDVLLGVFRAISPTRKKELYEDPTKLVSDTRQFYSAVCAQIVHQYMMTTTSDTLAGTVWTEKSRLVLNRLSLRLMEAGIAILIVSTGVLVLIRPSVRCLGGLSTLGRISAILAGSNTLETALKGSGSQRIEIIAEKLAVGLYNTDQSTSLDGSGLCIRSPSPASIETPAEKEDAMKWWVPLALGRYTQWVIAIVPLLLIVALEVTFHFPQRSRGLGSVEENAKYVHYAWTLLPGSIMTALKLLQQSLTFSIELLDPYLVLKRGSAAASSTLMSVFLSCNALQACFRSARTQRFAVFSIAFSTLLTPFLTIITSGLFLTHPITSTETTSVARLDRLLSPSDTNASICTSWPSDRLIAADFLIREASQYPRGSHGDYMFPSVTLPTNETLISSPNLNNASTLTANLTALRSNFICEPLEPSAFQFHVGKHALNDLDFISHNYTTINYTHAKFRDCCKHGSPSLTKNFNMYNEPGAQPFSIYEYRLSWTCEDSDPGTDPTLSSQTHNDPRSTCPDLTLVHTNITAHPPTMIGIACRYRVEEVPINLTYDLKQGMASDVRPVGEAKALEGFDKNCFARATDFEHLIRPHGLTGFTYDRLMLAALNGSDPSTMLTPEKLPMMVGRVAQICNTFTTQYLSDVMRKNLTAGPMINATLSSHATKECVFQDRTSTTILEILLGIIFICTFIALWLFESDQLVPKDPCSIAAQASLLAGSDFLHLIQSGSESLSNTRLAQTTPFKDHLFSIGWWTKEDGTRTFGIDIGQADDEEQEKDEEMADNVEDIERGGSQERRSSQEQENSRDRQGQVEIKAGIQ